MSYEVEDIVWFNEGNDLYAQGIIYQVNEYEDGDGTIETIYTILYKKGPPEILSIDIVESSIREIHQSAEEFRDTFLDYINLYESQQDSGQGSTDTMSYTVNDIVWFNKGDDLYAQGIIYQVNESEDGDGTIETIYTIVYQFNSEILSIDIVESSIRNIHPLSEEYRDTFLGYIAQYQAEQTNSEPRQNLPALRIRQTGTPSKSEQKNKTLLMFSNIPLFILVILFIYSFISSFISNGLSKIPTIIIIIRAIIIILFIIQLFYYVLFDSPPSYIFILTVVTYFFILITHIKILRKKSTATNTAVAKFLNPVHRSDHGAMPIGA